jgi:hypothetical protein
MGLLIYGAGPSEIEIEDRTLAHLQLVITAKLRRNEQFMLTWTNPPERGSGRSAVWISPHVPVHFKYLGSRTPAINRAWLDVLMEAANDPGGLMPIPEPDEIAK